MKKVKNKTKAFTLIELLVVIAIIAMLVGILSVGLRQVKIFATNLKQKGEFHGMEVSIALFQNDFENYPDSAVVENTGGTTPYVCGAQRLAEAMEGRDEQGFHPKSKWHPDLEDAANPLYNIPVNDTTKKRKPVYFELKHSGLYTPEELWGTGNAGSLQEDQCPVITDVFVRNEADDPYNQIDEKVGAPVLYFKADSTKRFRMDDSNEPETATLAGEEYISWIYNFDDNLDLLRLPWLRDPTTDTVPVDSIYPHYAARDDYPDVTEKPELFYQIITQREQDLDDDGTMDHFRPYNKDTYILISAGWDGLYGTKDDLTNYNY